MTTATRSRHKNHNNRPKSVPQYMNPGSYIASLRGEVIDLGLDHAVIECSGIGYYVHITAQTAANLRAGETGFVYTSMIIREDAILLYGFADPQERELFLLLQKVSGVGPRLALVAIASLGCDRMCYSIGSGDITTLATVPGIGKKVAERLTMELKDTILQHHIINISSSAPVQSTETELPDATPLMSVSSMHDDVITALQGLGFSYKESYNAVQESVTISQDIEDTHEKLIKRALSVLGR